jgi:transcriptional regulator of acetoin/glycerol metabolism
MKNILDSVLWPRPVRETSLDHLPTLDDLVNEYVRKILALTHYNISQTARILNISRTTLYRRIRGGSD